METNKLRRFSLFARRILIEQVQVKLDAVLAEASTARRENEKAVKELEEQVAALGKEQLVERVAYTWFNRFCALRYMDVNRYTRIGVLSPELGRFQPEILAEAKMGHIDQDMVPDPTRQKIAGLLDGSLPSQDPQSEAYRLLLVAACNYYHNVMPFLFETISDYTELLLPDDLLSGNSILAYTREALLPANCSSEYTDENVEVIGWLYQFYISEKKDEVFASLKEGNKIAPENIPAATQLFTPHWIVRYLMENSLGRLWMLNHPESKLVERMDYYIRPEEPETDFLRISSPEEIKICDPACGSGHMLTYAFDLLYAIYEEQGYQANDIPRLILQNNLYGIEIDQRAGALAAFALTMKARERHKRFLSSGNVVQPNICVLENVHIAPEDLSAYMDHVGRELFSAGLQGVVNQFEEAGNFGSLIRPAVTDVSEVLELLRERRMGEDLFLAGVHQKVLRALTQADYLSPKYHVVVANPPYMGARGMNRRMTEWVKEKYPLGNSDLFSMFIERSFESVIASGVLGIISLPSWLFLSSFQELREHIARNYFVSSMLHMGRGIFGIDWGSVAFVIQTCQPRGRTGQFYRLHERVFQNIRTEDIEWIFLQSKGNDDFRFDFGAYGEEKNAKPLALFSNGNGRKVRYRASSENFQRIPGAPFAYWFSEAGFHVFDDAQLLAEIADVKTGMTTADNERFVRYWTEINFSDIGFMKASREEALESKKKWFPYNKGGGFRKWYGFNENVLNWENDGAEIKSNVDGNGKRKASVRGEEFYFRECISYSAVSSKHFSARFSDKGFIFDSGGSSVFPKGRLCDLLAILCSRIPDYYLSAYNDTINFQTGDVSRIPVKMIPDSCEESICKLVGSCISASRADWDSYERSWEFGRHPLLGTRQSLLSDAFFRLRAKSSESVARLQELETAVNAMLMSTYALEGEFAAEVDIKDISLDRNPLYRYGSDKIESELEAILLADTMREFISYAVGCMFGRYSLDKPGLILANQGQTAEDYRRQIPEPTFPPDEDNVIPLLDGDWFSDDISERFKTFLKITFGTERYEENLTFLENALYPENLQGKRRKAVRDYFLKEFYDHHVKMYKKRPIYWLFSSPKGTFNALIYMHRYRPDTVSVVLNDYLREFHAKLSAKVDHLQTLANSGAASAADKAKALKEITKVKKDLKELEDYEHNVLYPLATRQVEIDLDDGVLVNYKKFGKAVKRITGLSE